jgi:hypothetical protein
MDIDSKPPPFKICSMCQARWETCRQFIEDPDLMLNGYFADFTDPPEGLILVTHHIQGCGSTLGVKAGQLEHLYTGPRYFTRNTGNPECGGRCMSESDFTPCGVDCDMHWIREILQMIKHHRYPANISSPAVEDQP